MTRMFQRKLEQLAICAALATATYAQAPEIWKLADRVVAPAAPPGLLLGGAVALDGDTLAATQLGKVHVFVRTGGSWTQQAVLAPPGGISTNVAIALDGDNLVLGRRNESSALSSPGGTFHIYHRTGTTWTQEHAGVGFAGDQLGYTVAMHGDRACVGAGSLTAAPRAQVFRRSGTSWVTEAWLAVDSVLYEVRSVAIDDDSAYVCAIRHVGGGTVTDILSFRREGAAWPLQQTIYDALDARAIAVSGDTLVAGAPENDTLGANAGLAYVYERRNGIWQSEATLAPCEVSSGAYFGRSVAIEGTTIAVGSQTEFNPGSSSGAVYVYTRDGEWHLRQRLTLAAAATTGGFGRSVAISDGEIASGSPEDDGPATNCGAVYLFALATPSTTGFCFGDGSATACPCSNDGDTGHGCAGSYDPGAPPYRGGFLGTHAPAQAVRKPPRPPGARLDGYGLASVANDRVTMSCIGVPPGAAASLFQGTAQQNGGNGIQDFDGLRCIGGSLVHIATTTSCAGNAFFPASAGPMLSVLGGVPAGGGTFHYQVLYADARGPCGTGTNFSNGVTVTWTP